MQVHNDDNFFPLHIAGIQESTAENSGMFCLSCLHGQRDFHHPMPLWSHGLLYGVCK